MAIANAPVPVRRTPEEATPTDIRVHNCKPHVCPKTGFVLPETVVFLGRPTVLACHYQYGRTRACLGPVDCATCSERHRLGEPPNPDQDRDVYYFAALLHEPGHITDDGKLIWSRCVYMLSKLAGKKVAHGWCNWAFQFWRKGVGSSSHYESRSLGRVRYLAKEPGFDVEPIVLHTQFPKCREYAVAAIQVQARQDQYIYPPSLYPYQAAVIAEPYKDAANRPTTAEVRPTQAEAAANSSKLKGFLNKRLAGGVPEVPAGPTLHVPGELSDAIGDTLGRVTCDGERKDGAA